MLGKILARQIFPQVKTCFEWKCEILSETTGNNCCTPLQKWQVNRRKRIKVYFSHLSNFRHWFPNHRPSSLTSLLLQNHCRSQSRCNNVPFHAFQFQTAGRQLLQYCMCDANDSWMNGGGKGKQKWGVSRRSSWVLTVRMWTQGNKWRI